MPPILQKRIVGLPAWAWVAVLAGGLTIGLILRSRNSASDVADEEYVDAPVDATSSDYADPYGEDYAYSGNPSYLLSPSSAGYGGYGEVDYSDQVYQGAYDAVTDNWPDAFNGTDATTTDAGTSSTTTPTVTKPGNVKKCGKKPAASPGKGKHWECDGGRWRAKRDSNSVGDGGDDSRNGGHHNGGHGDGHGGNGGRNKLLTGGGAPKRAQVHTQPVKRAPVAAAAVRPQGGNGGGKKKNRK